MGNTSTLVKIPISNEQLLNQVEELKALLPERERQLLQLNQQLNHQINTLTKERDNLAGQVKNFDTWRQDILNRTQQQIQQKEQEHKQSKAIIQGVNRSRETELQRDNDRLNSILKDKTDELDRLNREIERLEQYKKEQDTLLKSRTEELDKLKSIETKIDFLIELNNTILETVKKNDIKLVETLNKPDISIEEIKKTVENNKKRMDINISNKKRIQSENETIMRGLMSGKTQKQIADELWPDINSRYSKICERLKTKWFDDKGVR